MRASIALTAGCWLAGSALGQSFVPIVVPTTASQSVKVKDMTPTGSVALVEKLLPSSVPGPGTFEYSFARPDGSNGLVFSAVQTREGYAINGAGDALWHTWYQFGGPIRRVQCYSCIETFGEGVPFDVSPDEHLVLAARYDFPIDTFVAFVWNRDTGETTNLVPGGGQWSAVGTCMTADGALIGGWSAPSNNPPALPTVWRGSVVGEALPIPLGRNSGYVHGVSASGVAVGEAWTVYSENRLPVRWTATGVAEPLSTALAEGVALTVSGDGRVIGGYERTSTFDETALVWLDGVRHDLKQYLLENGVSGLTGYRLSRASHVSADGRTFSGVGRTSSNGWIIYFATIPPMSPVCPADIGRAGGIAGHDGLLDNNDFIAFINAFFAGDAAGDLGQAGGALGSDGAWNNNDFIAFITLFFSGCD